MRGVKKCGELGPHVHHFEDRPRIPREALLSHTSKVVKVAERGIDSREPELSSGDQALRELGSTPSDRLVIREEPEPKIYMGRAPESVGSDGARVGPRRNHGSEYRARKELATSEEKGGGIYS